MEIVLHLMNEQCTTSSTFLIFVINYLSLGSLQNSAHSVTDRSKVLVNRKMSDSAVECLSDCALIFQFWGHQYFSVASLFEKNQRKRPTIRYTLQFFVSVFIQSSQMGALAHLEHSNETLSAKNFLTIVVRYAMYFGLVFIICISLIQSYAATASMKQFYRNCIRIAKMFEVKCSVRIDHSQVKKALIRKLIFVVVFFVVNECYVYSMDVYFDKKLRPFLEIAAAFLPTMFLATIALKFMFFVQMINLHLAMYNKALKKLFQQHTTQNLANFIKNIVVIPPNSDTTEATRLKLKDLRSIYFAICENVEIVNHSMGATILTVIVVMVITFTSIIYKCCLILFHTAPVHSGARK